MIDGITPVQSRGLWGPRDICKTVLELPIPKYDASNPAHNKCAKIGKECSAKVQLWLSNGSARDIRSIGKLRSMARQMLTDELKEIDTIVKRIVK